MPVTPPPLWALYWPVYAESEVAGLCRSVTALNTLARVVDPWTVQIAHICEVFTAIEFADDQVMETLHKA